MKKWSIIIIVILVAATIVFAFSIITKIDEQTRVTALKVEGQAMMTALEAEGQATLSALTADDQTKVSILETEGQAKVSTLEAEGQATVDALKAEAQATLSVLTAENQAKVTTLKTAVLCEHNTSNIDYSDNSTVSLSLKIWLEATQGRISERIWNSVWYNSNTAIHKLTGKNLYVFIVYFDEPKLSFSRGVFNLSGMCWLDIP
jgi:hypothetical protein